MPRAVVVLGTDTGVGKTVATCATGRALRARGHRVLAIKPVETGCADPPSPDEDGVRLARATGQERPTMALRRFRAPVAPAIAADLESAPVALAPLVSEIRQLAERFDIVLIEGAGGALSPVAWDWNAIDLGRALNARAIVVAADRLGAINHVLLTLSALRTAGIVVSGVVLSAAGATDASSGSNAGAIARLAPAIPHAVLPRLTPATYDTFQLENVASWIEA